MEALRGVGAGKTIAAFAEQKNATLIVVGSRGYGSFLRGNLL